MTNLTTHTSSSTFTLSRPGNSHITFALATDPDRPHMTRMTLPPGSTWSPEPHWHEHYDETLQVIHGRILLILDGRETIVTAGDGPKTVPRFVVHDWMRAESGGEEVVVEEWTEPLDANHQVFFRNLIGVVLDAERYWKSWTSLQLALTSIYFDNWSPVSTAWPKSVNYVAAHAQWNVLRAVARLLGLRASYEEYTPVGLRKDAARGPHL